MRFLLALSAVAILGLTSSAMAFESAPSQISSGSLTQSLQSLEVRKSTKPPEAFSVAQRGRTGSFFSRLMELERRKNAWLRGLIVR